jgi:hypothetical protein
VSRITAVNYRPPILLLGDGSPPEFAAARDWLRARGEVVEARRLDDAPLARRLDDGWHPELIVGLQNRPGQWREDEMMGCVNRWPLAVLVTLQGSWCEGEPRTGRPLPGVPRVLWHQWEAAFELFWEDADQPAGRADRAWRHPWRQPRIRGVNETWLDPLPPSAEQLPPGCLIAIDAAEPAGFDTLAEVCVSAGAVVARFRPEWPGEVRGAAAVVWDEPGWSRSDGERLADCVRAAATTPVVALLGMLRWHDWRHAASLGVAVTLAKPFPLAHLLWHLNRIARIPSGRIKPAERGERPAAARELAREIG